MQIKDFQSGYTRQLKQILHTLKTVHNTDLKLETRSAQSLQKISEASTKIKNKIINESRFNTYNTNPSYAKHMLIIEAIKILLKEVAPKRRPKNLINEDAVGPTQPNAPQMATSSANTPSPDATSNAAVTGSNVTSGNNITVQKGTDTKTINANQLNQFRGQGYNVVSDVQESKVRMTPELAALMKKYGVTPGATVDEANAFDMAAAAAKVKDKKSFNFDGKKYPEKMSGNAAKKIVDENKGRGYKMTPELSDLMKKYGVNPGSTVDEGTDLVPVNKPGAKMTPELAALMKQYNVKPKSRPLVLDKVVESKVRMTPELAALMKKYGIKAPGSDNTQALAEDDAVSNTDYTTLAKEHVRAAKAARDTNDADDFKKHADLANYFKIKAGIEPGKRIIDKDKFCRHVEKSYAKDIKLDESKMISNKKRLAETVDFDDHHASIARSELYRNTKYAMDMFKMIKVGDVVDGWISSNLASAAEALDKIYHHLDYTEKFEPETLPEDLDIEVGDDVVTDDNYSVDRENLMLIVEYSTKLFNIIQPGDKLEGWVAMKLTTASENVSSAKHFLEYKQFEKHAGDMMASEAPTSEELDENIGTMLMKMMINEDQDLEQAQTLLAAKALSDELQSMAEKVAKMSVEDLMPLVDTMKSQFGMEQAEGYNSVMKGGFDALLASATSAKDTSDNAIMQLQSGGIPGQASTDIENADGGDETTSDPIGDAMSGEEGSKDGDDGLNSTAPASGKVGNPVGREKKDDAISENWDAKMNPNSKDKGKWKDHTIADLKAKKNKLMDKESRTKEEQKEVSELNFAIRAKQKDKWGKVDEAKKFINENMQKFVTKYGASGEQRLYALAWTKFGNKSDAYKNAVSVLENDKRKMTNLKAVFESHKMKHARQIKEGKSVDPTNVGYGLTGQVILDKMVEVNESTTKAKAIITSEMSKGAKAIAEAQNISKKIGKIVEAKKSAPYGVTWSTKSGRSQRKFFETAELRKHWVELKKSTILSENYKLVNPSDFDNTIKKLSSKKA